MSDQNKPTSPQTNGTPGDVPAPGLPQPMPGPMPIDLEPLPDYAPPPPPPPPPTPLPTPPPSPKNTAARAVSLTAFIKPGMGSAQVVAIAGGVVLLVAVIGAVWNSWSAGTGWWAKGLLTAYLGIVHACTGAAAAGFVGYALGREIGDIPLAAARMLLGVALLLVMINIGLPAHPILVWMCAIGAYTIVTLVLFRWEIAEWGSVASVHALLWFVMFLAAKLQVMVAAAPVKPA